MSRGGGLYGQRQGCRGSVLGVGVPETALENGDREGVNAQVDRLTTAQDGIRQYVAESGARMSSLNISKENYQVLDDKISGLLSETEDVDLEQVIVEFKMKETALQAAYAMSVQIGKLSILDYLPDLRRRTGRHGLAITKTSGGSFSISAEMRVYATPGFGPGPAFLSRFLPCAFPGNRTKASSFGKTGRYVRVKGHRNQKGGGAKGRTRLRRRVQSQQNPDALQTRRQECREKTQKRRLESWLSVTSH